MDQSARFWDKAAERYSKRPITNEAAYQRKLQITRDYLRADMEVLEIGCGTGSTAILHSPYVKSIQAIDMSSKMLEIAQSKVDSGNIRNITFRCSTIDAFSAPDQTFDAVLALSVLHLLDDKDAAIAKIHSVLKPGGIFVSSTACLGDTMKFFKLIAPIGKFLGVMPLVKVFTTKDLECAITGAGFGIEQQWQPGKNEAAFIVAKKPE